MISLFVNYYIGEEGKSNTISFRWHAWKVFMTFRIQVLLTQYPDNKKSFEKCFKINVKWPKCAKKFLLKFTLGIFPWACSKSKLIPCHSSFQHTVPIRFPERHINCLAEPAVPLCHHETNFGFTNVLQNIHTFRVKRFNRQI